MKFTTHFRLHSQTTWLLENVSQNEMHETMDGILTLYDALFQRTCASAFMENASSDYNSDLQASQILNLSSSRFTRRY
jgi:hypothetical protein